MQQENLYPNMEIICRLCLHENTGIVDIFPGQQQDNADNHQNMSIPMRIMACVALEVQTSDGLPKKICTDCRYQLEKTYLFRKQSQASDAKLRKHIRLLSLGKKSKVFQTNPEEEDDDQLEFFDSLEFIKQHDEKFKLEEKMKLDRLKESLRQENAVELKKSLTSIKAQCKEELRAEVEQNVKGKIREQIQSELEDQMIPKIRQECLQEAKESLREEMWQECRQSQMKNLLDDLETYLKDKQKPSPDPQVSYVVITQQNTRPLSPRTNNTRPTVKRVCYNTSSKKSEEESTTKTVDKPIIKENQQEQEAMVKTELILSDNASDMEINLNDDDGDSDNFLIYDTDECFEVQKKSDGGDIDGDVDENPFIEDQIQEYDSCEENSVAGAGDDDQKIPTISYSIEDTENGEIKFSKKSSENLPSHRPSDDGSNTDELNDANIMVINYPSEMGDEEHLEIVDYDDDFVNKSVKSIVMKGEPIKRYQNKSIEYTNIEGMSLPASDNYTTTTSTVETTLTTKTYVNTMQRITDTPKLFKCTDCPMAFSTKFSLERHLRTHRKVKETGVTNQCPECKIVVSCASALRRHMFIHCAEKPFVCTICSRSFVQKEILKRHMQIHTGIKPHQCKHCDRAFAQRINLKQHINRHHMEEPRIQQHACHLCPKRFNHASGLSRHLATHSGVAFQCSECNRTFCDRSSIKRHIAAKHGSAKVGKSEKQQENNQTQQS